jgi:hypothetical protein
MIFNENYSQGVGQIKPKWFKEDNKYGINIDDPRAAFITLLDRYKNQVHENKGTEEGYRQLVNAYKGIKSPNNEYLKNVFDYANKVNFNSDLVAPKFDYEGSKKKNQMPVRRGQYVESPIMANGGKLKKFQNAGLIKDPRQDSYYTPSSSDSKSKLELLINNQEIVYKGKDLPEVNITAPRAQYPTELGKRLQYSRDENQKLMPKKLDKITIEPTPFDISTNKMLHELNTTYNFYPKDFKDNQDYIVYKQFKPSLFSSNTNIQSDIEKQSAIKKLQSAIDFPLYKKEEQEKNSYISDKYGDQGETLKNVIFRDANDAQYLNKFYPDDFVKYGMKESLLPQREDTAQYLAALQLLKENGNPYITQNQWEEDEYRARTSTGNLKYTSNFSPSENRMYLEPYKESAFISELAHAQQQKEGWEENPSVRQQLEQNYNKELKINPKLAYNEYYDNNYYGTPGSVEHDAHTVRQPILNDRYRFLQDSFFNQLPFMSFKPAGIVEAEEKRKNAFNQPYYKGRYGKVRETINKGVDNILGTDFYTNLAYKNGGLLKAQNGFREINDNPFVQAAKIFDPTGVSSYPDVYYAGEDLYNNPSWGNAANLGINIFGALPMVGKFAIPAKLQKVAAKASSKAFGVSKGVNKVIDTLPEKIANLHPRLNILGIPTEIVQDYTAKKFVKPFADFIKKGGKSYKAEQLNKINRNVDRINLLNNSADVYSTITSSNNKKNTGGSVSKWEIIN